MAKNVHHIACATRDPAAVVSFATDVLGMPPAGIARSSGEVSSVVLGWPRPEDRRFEVIEAAIVGAGPAGLLEVIGIPDDLAAEVTPGPVIISVATRDLDAVIESCRSRGLEVVRFSVDDPNNPLSGIRVVVAGVPFEVVTFG